MPPRTGRSPSTIGLPKRHVSLGFVSWNTWEVAAAERELRRALELNSNLAIAHLYYARYLASLVRFSEAEKELEHAHELDPLSLQVTLFAGQLFYFRHQYDQSIAQYQKVLEIDPNYVTVHLGLSDTHLAKGQYAEAIEEGRLYLMASGTLQSRRKPNKLREVGRKACRVKSGLLQIGSGCRG